MFWSVAAERQIYRLRGILFRSILNKKIPYFDVNKTGELNARLTEGVSKVHDGIGTKIAFVLQYFATITTSVILAYVKNLNNEMILN